MLALKIFLTLFLVTAVFGRAFEEELQSRRTNWTQYVVLVLVLATFVAAVTAIWTAIP